MKVFVSITCFACWIFAASGVAAAPSLDEVLEDAHDSADGGFATLRAAGATYEGILTLERLPSGGYLSEVAVSVGRRTLRYPVKLERGAGGWSVAWQPDAAYASALVAIAKSGALPVARTDSEWAAVARMPALGVVATKARFVTPFGVVERAASGTKEPAGLAVEPTLVAHAQQWIQQALDEDPAPAGFDLLADGALDWKALNVAMFSLSSVGLYQIWLVTDGEGRLLQIPAAAPVGAVAGLQGPAVPVVALSSLGEQKFGFRVAPGGASQPPEEAPTAIPIGGEDARALAEALDGLLAPGGEHAMFAATGNVAVGDVVRFLAAFADYMGLAPHRILLGYVEE